jgi:hypothetical protein
MWEYSKFSQELGHFLYNFSLVQHIPCHFNVNKKKNVTEGSSLEMLLVKTNLPFLKNKEGMF